MNKFCTILSLSLSIACFAYMFNDSISISCIIGIGALALSTIGFMIESKAKYFWNTKLNRLIYYLSKNDREYNYELKEFTYACMKNNEYKVKKHFTIYPTGNKVDRIIDRYAWSAPSSKAIVDPLINEHKITDFRQQELWTYYCIYFQQICKKHKPYETGSIIHNLIDENGEAVPFLSATVDRKTKLLLLRVTFEGIPAPQKATFKVCPTKNPSEIIYREELSYDNAINGFSIPIDFPRQTWKYIISW